MSFSIKLMKKLNNLIPVPFSFFTDIRRKVWKVWNLNLN